MVVSPGSVSNWQPVTPARVLDAALTLFANRGYLGTSLKEVANLLGIRTPSLYNHMTSKSGLLETIVLGQLEAIRIEFDAAILGIEDPVEKLRRATEVYALRHARYWRETIVLTESLMHLDEPSLGKARILRRENERRFRNIIIEGQKAGVFEIASARFASFVIREACVSLARLVREVASSPEYEEIGEYPEYGEYGGANQPTGEDLAAWHGQHALKIVGAKVPPER